MENSTLKPANNALKRIGLVAKQLLFVGSLAVLMSCSSSSDGADTPLSKEEIAKLDAQRISLRVSLAQLYPKGQMTALQEKASKALLQQNPAALKISGLEATRGVVPQIATAATFMPVYRIQNTTLSGSYFFSIWETEKNAALAANPAWNYEGPAFYASQTAHAGLSPVWRFRNKINGSYLFTVYEGERASIASTYADTFEYEGVAWYASQTEASGYQPLYRFRNLTNGTYLFSAYDSEKRDIIANYPGIFEYEGVSYYVKLSAVSDRPVDTVITNPLAITSQLQPNVIEVPLAASANWVTLSTTTDDSGGIWPSSISAPSSTVISNGSIFILNDQAHKVLSIATDRTGNKVLTVVRPDVKEIFSVLKINGKIPLYPFTAQAANNATNQNAFESAASFFGSAGGSKTVYTNLVTHPGFMSVGDYDNSFGGGVKCLDIRTGFPLNDDEEGPFLLNGERIWPSGITIVADRCRVKNDSTALKALSVGGVIGSYGAIDFSNVDALNADELAQLKMDLFARFNGEFGIEAGLEVSKIRRLLGGNLGPLPGAPGLSVIMLLDLIVKAEAKGNLNFATYHDFSFGKAPNNWTGYAKKLPHNNSNKSNAKGENIIGEVGIDLSLSAQLRPGIGIAGLGQGLFSFNPRIGLEAEATVDQATLGCMAWGLYIIGGFDIIGMPNYKYFSDIRKEMDRTMNMGTYRWVTLREPLTCPTPKALITQYTPDVKPPLLPDQPVGATYKLKPSSEYDYGFDNGDTFSAVQSTNATTYLWEILSGTSVLASHQAPRVRVKKSTTFIGATVSIPTGAGLPTFNVWPGHTVRLTVKSADGRTNSKSFLIVGNQPPFGAGIVQELPDNFISLNPIGSLDTDGRIVKVEWRNTAGTTLVAQSAGLQPVTIHRNLLAGQRPAILRMTVYDNDGAVYLKLITETLLPDPAVTSITPATATLNTPTVFTVTGTNLPSTAILAVADAICLDPVNNPVVGTGFSQTCTPLAIGTKTITVKTASSASGGTIIDATRAVNITSTPVVSYRQLPDTGITATQCYAAGSNAIVSCLNTAAIELNDSQDGMRNNNQNVQTRYLKIDSTGLQLDWSSLTWSCVKDNATGLVWENFDPLRINKNITGSLYTSFGDGRGGDFSEHINSLNAMKYCGLQNWHAPKIHEFVRGFDFSVIDPNPYYDYDFNSQQIAEYSKKQFILSEYKCYANIKNAFFSSTFNAWFSCPLPWGAGMPEFKLGFRGVAGVDLNFPSPAIFSTYINNNEDSEMLDENTGLIWRRMPLHTDRYPQGLFFKINTFTLDEAYTVAKNLALSTGKKWRLPNIIELTNLKEKNPASFYFLDVDIHHSTPNFLDGKKASAALLLVRDQ